MELPASFAENTRALLGDEAYGKLAAALGEEPPVSIRLNPWRTVPSTHSLSARVPWSSQGYYLDNRLTFTFDPLLHAGCYYVQEASSMFVEQALKQYVTEPAVMLDLCAAPGGKSTHARATLPEGSLLVANEVIRNRSQILAENLTKWGHPGVVVTNNDPADFAPLEEFFDVILTDVPCSGEGMFRKDPGAVGEWSPENVDICWQRQRRIVADIWPCLRPGGLFIYSTCTYNTKEDEENVAWMQRELGAQPLPVTVLPEWNITGSLLPVAGPAVSGQPVSSAVASSYSTSDDASRVELPVCRFLPHRTRGEGFFLAVLRKPGESEERRRSFAGNAKAFSKKTAKKASKDGGVILPKEALSAAARWLGNSDDFELLTEGGTVTAFPKEYVDELAALRQSLRLVQAGITLAEVKGKDLIPAHALAMSRSLHRACFPTEELTYEQAIAYLRKESIVLPADAPRGYVLLTYRDIPLGFAKNIGNRANNLYPPEWRIRSGYLPEKLLLF